MVQKYTDFIYILVQYSRLIKIVEERTDFLSHRHERTD